MDVTRRAMIDPLRKCPLQCEFCYYRYAEQTSIRPLEEIQRCIQTAAERGNTAVDITGGEPLAHPDIVEMVQYCRSHDLAVRVISSLVGPRLAVDRLIGAEGVGWLVSMHGLQDVHNATVGIQTARQIQEIRLESIAQAAMWDVNCVITSRNQNGLAAFADYLVTFYRGRLPRIVNFINFNPHYEWRAAASTRDLVADLRIVETQLNTALGTLESAGVGCNVRYYPMCCVAPHYRRCVCNDLHVAFDSGEWSNDLRDLTIEFAEDYGRRLSSRIEEKGLPCSQCGLQWICGGANKHLHAASRERDGELLQPQPRPDGEADAMYYRRLNLRGMA